MVIHDRSYSRWDGDKTAPARAWAVILDRGVVTGLNLLFKRKFFAVMFILSAYGPFLAVIGALYLNFFFMTNPEFDEASRWMQEGPWLDALTPRGESAFFYLFNIQEWFALVLCVIIGAGLIAEDRRTNALELYLSRPVLVFDYVLGKLAVLGFFIAMVTVVPGLILIVVYMVLNGLEAQMVVVQLELMGRVVMAGALAGLVPAVLVLTASSLSKRARSAAIAFVGFLVLLEGVISGMLHEGFRDDALKVVSIHFNVSQCVAWLLDSPVDLDPTVPLVNSIIVLVGWLVLCCLIILRKVRPVEIVA